ncbi:MAG: 23S rRNA (guanosine(2251)-2'-O)-methyltransferase RlmB [Christensenellales bacterium]|jgi:23S rRNA (guanosine2251-2'-O)-methyltransferase
MKDDKRRPPRFSRRVQVPPAVQLDAEVRVGADARRGEAELPENLLIGRNPIREAIKSGASVEKLIVSNGDLSGAAREIIQLARDAGIVVQKIDRQRLDAIAPAHQGMVAYVAAAAYATVDELIEVARARGEAPFLVVLDGVTDPHNLGAVIRSAECTGAHGVIIPERRASGLTPAAAKAAAGALSHIKVARVKNLNRTIDELKQAGLWIVAAALDGEDATRADFSGAIALVIGSEGEGISHLTLSKCDRRVSIPIKGRIESYNASVAAGILLYEVMRARA